MQEDVKEKKGKSEIYMNYIFFTFLLWFMLVLVRDREAIEGVRYKDYFYWAHEFSYESAA